MKGTDVELQGRFHLNLGRTQTSAPNSPGAPAAAPHVCIVENCPEFAVIEFACSCGRKTQVKCEYTNDNPGQDSATADETPAGEKQD